METPGFDNQNLMFFRSSVNSLLKDTGMNPDAGKFVSEQLIDTFVKAKNELKVFYPISFRPSDKLSDLHYLDEKDSYKISYAFFKPMVNRDGKVDFGELVLWVPALKELSKSVERQKGSLLTPWSLIGTVAHEMRHASQENIDHNAVVEDAKLPYNAQFFEYDANAYAYEYLSKQKPLDFQDRVERFFELQGIRKTMKNIKKNRKELGLK
jgi:hypothetical protein